MPAPPNIHEEPKVEKHSLPEPPPVPQKRHEPEHHVPVHLKPTVIDHPEMPAPPEMHEQGASHPEEHLPEFPTMPEPPMHEPVAAIEHPEPVHATPEPVHFTPPEPAEQLPKGPSHSFLSMDEYQELATQANGIKDRLKDSERLVKELADLRTEEEKSFDKWRTLLENLEKKLSYVDTLVAEGEKL